MTHNEFLKMQHIWMTIAGRWVLQRVQIRKNHRVFRQVSNSMLLVNLFNIVKPSKFIDFFRWEIFNAKYWNFQFLENFSNLGFQIKTVLGNKYGYGDLLVDDQHICIKSKWDSEKAGFCNLADNGAPVSGQNWQRKIAYSLESFISQVFEDLNLDGPGYF